MKRSNRHKTHKRSDNLLMLVSVILIIIITLFAGFRNSGKAVETKCLISSGVVGLWSAEKNADDTLKLSSGRVEGKVSYVTGKLGDAFSFDSGVVIAPAAFYITNRLSVAFWANPSAVSGYQTYVSKWGAGKNSFIIQSIDDKVAFYVNGNTQAIATSNNVIKANEWQHIIFTYDGTSKVIKLFINGINQPLNINGLIPASISALSNDFRIGNDLTGKFPYSGPIDEIQLYNKALTSQEVNLVYSTGSNGCAPVCGDGILALEEQCDDGNKNNEDDCKNNCEYNVCGDGVFRTGFEQCDDGNKIETDICRNNCIHNICGDKILREGVEQCDDGNRKDGDGCSRYCELECDPGCTDWSSCINGQRFRTCANDKCGSPKLTEDCSVQKTIAPVQQNVQPVRCGDGIVSGSETCDDRNTASGDGCSSSCQIEIVCDGPACAPSQSCNRPECQPSGNTCDGPGC